MRALPSILTFFAIAGVSATALADGRASSILYPGEYLYPGQRIVSDGCYNHLEMQSDGNLVLYGGPGTGYVRWAAGAPYTCTGGPWPFARACITYGAGWSTLQWDGNFVQYDATETAFFNTETSGGNGSGTAQIWVQDDGNLVEYRSVGGSTWAAWSANSQGGEHVGQSPCGMQTSVTHIEENTNLGGSDYHAQPTNDSRDCPAWCAASAYAPSGTQCHAFTWVPPGIQAATGMCWLKNAIPGASYASGMYSGYIRH